MVEYAVVSEEPSEEALVRTSITRIYAVISARDQTGLPDAEERLRQELLSILEVAKEAELSHLGEELRMVTDSLTKAEPRIAARLQSLVDTVQCIGDSRTSSAASVNDSTDDGSAHQGSDLSVAESQMSCATVAAAKAADGTDSDATTSVCTIRENKRSRRILEMEAPPASPSSKLKRLLSSDDSQHDEVDAAAEEPDYGFFDLTDDFEDQIVESVLIL